MIVESLLQIAGVGGLMCDDHIEAWDDEADILAITSHPKASFFLTKNSERSFSQPPKYFGSCT